MTLVDVYLVTMNVMKLLQLLYWTAIKIDLIKNFKMSALLGVLCIG